MLPTMSEKDPIRAARIASAVRSQRGLRDWTQADLSAQTGLTPRTIGMLESGRGGTKSTLLSVARAFGMDSVDSLVACGLPPDELTTKTT